MRTQKGLEKEGGGAGGEGKTLAANEKKTITLVYTPAEDITGPTCAPTVQLILQKGQMLEIGDVKIAEE